jgi:8-oxo-dGTP diphosphatase
VKTTLRVAAKAVIIDEQGRALILREANTYEEGTNIGKWGVPGGRIEPDEPFYDGLMREVREETGLEIKVVEPIYVGEWWPEIKGVKNHIVAMFMLCETTSRLEVRLSKDHDRFAWIASDELSDYFIVEPEPEVLEKAFEDLKSS